MVVGWSGFDLEVQPISGNSSVGVGLLGKYSGKCGRVLKTSRGAGEQMQGMEIFYIHQEIQQEGRCQSTVEGMGW